MPRVAARRKYLDECLAHEDWKRFGHLGLFCPDPPLFPNQKDLFEKASAAGFPTFSKHPTNVLTVRMVAALIGTDVIWGTLDKFPPEESKTCSGSALQSGLHFLFSTLGSAIDWFAKEASEVYQLRLRDDECGRGKVKNAFKSGLGRLLAKVSSLKGPDAYLSMCSKTEWVWRYRNHLVHGGFVEMAEPICGDRYKLSDVRIRKHPKGKHLGPPFPLRDFCRSAFVDAAKGLNTAYEGILADWAWILEAHPRKGVQQNPAQVSP
jgi:hypothetical protein